MKKIINISGIFLLILLSISGTVNAQAFNKNNIISDIDFGYSNMSKDDIQSFLESKGSALANYQTERAWNISTNSWGDTTIIQASQVIYEASIDNNISPKVILTMLQKGLWDKIVQGSLNRLLLIIT